MEDKDDYLRIGVITGTHGLKGELKVFPTTDDLARFETLEECVVKLQTGYEVLKPVSVKFFKKFVFIKFDGYDDINDVLCFTKHDLLVSRENAVELEEGEYFICDLLGNTVVTEDGEKLGILKDIMTSAANNVYVVQRNTQPGLKDILIPAIDDCIVDHDIKNKVTTVRLLKGLLDI